MAITITVPKMEPAASTDGDRLLTAAQLRCYFGGVSDMTIYRWLKDAKLGFPKPVFICTNRYWRLAEIEAFVKAQEKARASKKGQA